MDSHPIRGKGLEWLEDEERLRVVELALLEKHGMTLPPEKQPLRDFDRSGQITWRRTALSDTRRDRKKAQFMRKVWRVLTLRLLVEVTDRECQEVVTSAAAPCPG